MNRFYKGCVRAVPVVTSDLKRTVILYDGAGNLLDDEGLRRFGQMAVLNTHLTRKYNQHYRPGIPLREAAR